MPPRRRASSEFILAEGVEKIREKEKSLTRHALEVLARIEGVEIYGQRDAERQVGVVSFNLAGVDGAEMAYVLDEVYGTMVRVGLH